MIYDHTSKAQSRKKSNVANPGMSQLGAWEIIPSNFYKVLRKLVIQQGTKHALGSLTTCHTVIYLSIQAANLIINRMSKCNLCFHLSQNEASHPSICNLLIMLLFVIVNTVQWHCK